MTTATYDKDNDPLSVVSPMGVTTRVTYDDLGLPVSVIDAVGTPDAATVTIAHHDPEHPADVTSITDPSGAVTTFSYDHHGDVISRTDALGNVSAVSRDELGWVLSMTDALGATTTITPDRQGRPVVLADPLGGSTSLARDAMGRPTSTTDTLGNTVTLANDATGRTTEVALPDGTVLATGYDAIGASVSQTDGDGASWLLPRDDHGRQVGWVDPLGNAWQIAYDAADRLTRSTDPLGNVTSYQWDAADQLLAIDYPDDTPDVTFTHDLDGRRASMTDGTGTTGYSWDALGRLRSVTDGSGRTVDASYDARGFLRSITYPDGQIVEQDHDALGRLTAVRDGLGHSSTFEWDAAGRLVRTVQGDGSVTTQSRDARGDVTAITAAADGGPQILDIEYARDALGHVAGISYPLADSTMPVTRDTRGRLTAVGPDTFGLDRDGALTRLRTVSLTYDAAGRLMSAEGPEGLTTFTNDAAGRRVSATPADGERMAYGWDAAGRLTDAGGTQYAYDGDGLRTSVVDEDGSAAAFTWLRADGRPRLLTDGSSSWVYGPGGLPLEEIRADGSLRWLHADQGGSIRAVTDQTGAVVATADWDAYGEITRSTGESIGRLGFQGNYTDAHTGLQYLQARYYDPITGGYLSVDPRVRSTRQPYAFAAGDPLTYRDPAGTDPLVMPGASVPSVHGTWPAPGRETFAGASVAGAAAEGGRYGGVQVEARPEAGIGPGSDSTHADSNKLDLGTCLGLGGKIQVDVGVYATTIAASDAIAAAAAAVASDIVGASSMLVGP
jgi:RHS repeat-associated protein